MLSFLSDAQTLVGGKPVDAPLDLEQRVNALDRLQRHRRDRGRPLPTPRVRSNIGELEKLSPRVGPTQGGRNRSVSARGIVQLVIAAIGIGLQNATEVLQMPRRMLMPAITGGVIERRRW
jgi:hypothetical protein